MLILTKKELLHTEAILTLHPLPTQRAGYPLLIHGGPLHIPTRAKVADYESLKPLSLLVVSVATAHLVGCCPDSLCVVTSPMFHTAHIVLER